MNILNYFDDEIQNILVGDGLPRNPRQKPLPDLMHMHIASASSYADNTFRVEHIGEAIKKHYPAFFHVAQEYRNDDDDGDFTMFLAIVNDACQNSLKTMLLS
ncbi:hypothetical protein BGZ47_002474 [Haplosporangium gracile]|nr:hypothetical protein BGZ47_002474 [Haplosporangium gracile]